jgi:hypothetical protein
MDAGLIDRIEINVQRSASALFAAAVGFAIYRWLGVGVLQPELGAYTGGAVAIAYLLCSRTLRAVTKKVPRFAVPVFDVREIEWIEATDELVLTEADRLAPEDELVLTEADRLAPEDELVLTDADRLAPVDELVLTDADRLEAAAAPGQNEPLVLDDILAEIGPDARVVRLFDRKAMPTPGQLKSRIDRHLGQGSSDAAQSDASQALSDALAELKRSLR